MSDEKEGYWWVRDSGGVTTIVKVFRKLGQVHVQWFGRMETYSFDEEKKHGTVFLGEVERP